MSGSIYKKTLQNGSVRYEARTRLNGKPVGKRFKRKKDAEDWLSRNTVDVNDGTYRELKKGSFQEYVDHWKEAHLISSRYKPSTLIGYRSIVDFHLIPEFGNLSMTAISAADINAFSSRLLKAGKTTRTVRHALIVLGKILKEAAAEDYLRHSPMDRIKKPAIKKKSAGKAMSPAEIQKVLQTCAEIQADPKIVPSVKQATEKTRLLFLTAILTGLRSGELFGLNWKDLDFKNDQILVRRALFFKRGRYFGDGEAGPCFVDPKSDKSKRDIDLSPQLKKELLQLWISRGKPKDALIFSTAAGKPLDPINMKRNWPKLLQRAGLGHFEEVQQGKKVRRVFHPAYRWHDLRHTYGSLKLEQGENIYYVQRQMGHSSIQVTVDIYGHLLEKRKPEAAAKTDAMIFGS